MPSALLGDRNSPAVLLTCSVGMALRDLMPAADTLQVYGNVFALDTGCRANGSFPNGLTFSKVKNTLNACVICRGVEQYYTAHEDVRVNIPLHLVPTQTKGLTYIDYDRFCLFNATAFRDFGGYDEEMPQYGADCDLHGRIFASSLPFKALGLDRYVTHLGSQYRHQHSRLQQGPDANGINGVYSRPYIQKWGQAAAGNCNLRHKTPTRATAPPTETKCSKCHFSLLRRCRSCDGKHREGAPGIPELQ